MIISHIVLSVSIDVIFCPHKPMISKAETLHFSTLALLNMGPLVPLSSYG